MGYDFLVVIILLIVLILMMDYYSFLKNYDYFLDFYNVYVRCLCSCDYIDRGSSNLLNYFQLSSLKKSFEKKYNLLNISFQCPSKQFMFFNDGALNFNLKYDDVIIIITIIPTLMMSYKKAPFFPLLSIQRTKYQLMGNIRFSINNNLVNSKSINIKIDISKINDQIKYSTMTILFDDFYNYMKDLLEEFVLGDFVNEERVIEIISDYHSKWILIDSN